MFDGIFATDFLIDFLGLLVAWLHILLLHNSDALLEELPRNSCPPMDEAKQATNRADTSDRIRKYDVL